MNCLIVDDEDDVRQLVSELLEMITSVSTVSAPTAEKALELLEKHPGSVDFVISDIRMPGIGGIELARVMNQLYPQIPLALMSAFADISPEECRELGIRRLLKKPFSFDELTELIENLKN